MIAGIIRTQTVSRRHVEASALLSFRGVFLCGLSVRNACGMPCRTDRICGYARSAPSRASGDGA